eukprot:734297-Pleurochrysis_carterae.AAC.10
MEPLMQHLHISVAPLTVARANSTEVSADSASITVSADSEAGVAAEQASAVASAACLQPQAAG